MEKNVAKLTKTEKELAEAKKAQKTLEEERDQKSQTIRELEVYCMQNNKEKVTLLIQFDLHTSPNTG